MELSTIVERDIVPLKNGAEDAEKSTDSGVASTSGNNSSTGKDVMGHYPIIIEFEALNAHSMVPKESTFVTRAKNEGGDCDISEINGEEKNRSTLNSDGKFKKSLLYS